MNARRILCSLVLVALSLAIMGVSGMEEDYNIELVKPDTWVATDGLGRTLSGYKQVGPERKDRYVGMFYWTWHASHAEDNLPRNVQQILDSLDPDEAQKAQNDYHHPVWANYTGYHFWNEPIFGYYSTTDKYVLRKHAEMLADAGVDVIFFDCTNAAHLWRESYMALLETFSEARKQGVKTPQISFMLNFGPMPSTTIMLEKLYEDLYKDGKYKDLWFYWDGKPLIMAHPDGLHPFSDNHNEILEFFTFRRNEASYFTRAYGMGYWGWLSIYPQGKFGVDNDGNVEQMTVGVAQNATEEFLTAMNGKNVLGRSYTSGDYYYTYKYKNKKIKVDKNIENSKLYGLNFQQQWDYAIKNDPEFIFVTGWNEWVALRFSEWQGVENAFPDQFNDEYSRDIEPSKGDLKDHYYYQLVENIRRFKGVSKPEKLNAKKTIDIFGSLDQWDEITPFYHYTQNTWDRDHNGYKGTHYTNKTMRNDIRVAKVSFDRKNIYFYVETVDKLTSHKDRGWMRLFIDTRKATKNSKDWEEIEYVVNRINPTDQVAYVEKSKGGWNWEVVAEVKYSVKDNVLQLEIPRKVLGLNSLGDPVFNFKWADNNCLNGDIFTFYTDGDAAPGGRFMFHFNTNQGLSTIATAIITISVLAVAIVSTLLTTRKKRKERSHKSEF